MSALSWSLSFLAIGGGVAYAYWIYTRRELPVPGGTLLALLRALAITLVLLILWNPPIPGTGSGTDRSAGVALVDVSSSMAARDTDGGDAWTRARERAAALQRSGMRVLSFGSDVAPLTAEGIDSVAPAAAGSRLAPALEAAGEAGARTVTVVSDFRLEDPADVVEAARRMGVAMELVDVGGLIRNAGIAELSFPRDAQPGDSIPVTVAVFGEGVGAGETGELRVREEERVVAAVPVSIPGAGRLIRTELTLPPPLGEGAIRYEVSVTLGGDGFPDDDVRPAYVEVDPRSQGVLVLSFRPDWEPRFLVPVLGSATGLRVRGYLRLGDDRYAPMYAGAEAGESLDGGGVRALLPGTELLVLHGVDAATPPWALEAARTARRLLLFPRDRTGAASASLATGGSLSGEWYVAQDLPASPIAPELAGLELASLPPLTGVLPLSNPGDGIAPIRLQLGGRGAPEAAVALVTDADRRRAVALAAGFWRWGFRSGEPERAYRSLWSGVAGWLLGNEPLAMGPGVQPVRRVVPRDSAVAWRAPGLAATVLVLAVTGDGGAAVDTVLVGPDARFTTAALPPGSYAFRASKVEDGAEVGAGRFDVDGFAPELRSSPGEVIESLAGGDGPGAGAVARPAGRPLRTHPLPFLLVLTVLCAEWIGRRRKGLR